MGAAWLVFASGTGPDHAAPGVRLTVRTRSSSSSLSLIPPFGRTQWLTYEASSSLDNVAEKSSCTSLACSAMQQNTEQTRPADLSIQSKKVYIAWDFHDSEHNKALWLVISKQSGPLATRLIMPPWTLYSYRLAFGSVPVLKKHKIPAKWGPADMSKKQNKTIFLRSNRHATVAP